MNILDMAKDDFKTITGDGDGFAVAVTFESNGAEPVTVTVNATATRHRMGQDGQGQPVDATRASVTVSETLLTAEDYPVRNADGDVSMMNHSVSWTDAGGEERNYKIIQTFPDETLGGIVCILGNAT